MAANKHSQCNRAERRAESYEKSIAHVESAAIVKSSSGFPADISFRVLACRTQIFEAGTFCLKTGASDRVTAAQKDWKLKRRRRQRQSGGKAGTRNNI
jgi:hypothetical protein